MPLHSCLELSSTQGSANCSARRGRSDEVGFRNGLLELRRFLFFQPFFFCVIIIFLRNMELSISCQNFLILRFILGHLAVIYRYRKSCWRIKSLCFLLLIISLTNETYHLISAEKIRFKNCIEKLSFISPFHFLRTSSQILDVIPEDQSQVIVPPVWPVCRFLVQTPSCQIFSLNCLANQTSGTS